MTTGLEMDEGMELGPREAAVLRSVVEEYMHKGAPVGSKTLATRYPLGHSPATIRYIMAKLAEKGLLAQPHTSAGRVPTAQGLRYYIDHLMESRELSPGERHEIVSSYRERARAV